MQLSFQKSTTGASIKVFRTFLMRHSRTLAATELVHIVCQSWPFHRQTDILHRSQESGVRSAGDQEPVRHSICFRRSSLNELILCKSPAYYQSGGTPIATMKRDAVVSYCLSILCKSQSLLFIHFQGMVYIFR